MQAAIIYDIRKDYIKAVEAYEMLIRNDNALPDYWVKKGGNEFLKVLDSGIKKYPKDIELHFWRRYFLHTSYCEDFTEEECLNLFDLYGHKNKIPYFFLYQCNHIRYEEQKDELLGIIKGKETAKNLYIASLL